MRISMIALLCLPFFMGIGSQAPAQTSISIPSDSKFVLQVDLQSLKSSKIGATLMTAAKKAAMNEVGKKTDDAEFSLKKVHEALGMDPFEEIQGIVLCASDYEKPEKSLLGMVHLKKTTGNIEGLLLSLPGYEKSDYGKYEIHSAAPSNEAKFVGAIHKNAIGNHTLVVGVNKATVTGLLDSLDAKSEGNNSLKSIELESDRKMIATLQLLALPSKKIVGDGPQANIAALLSSFVLSVFEEDDEIEVRGAMKASTEKQADKIRQSIQGLAAMVELFVSLDDDADEDARKAMDLLKQVKVSQDGNSVRVKLRLPSAKIAEMIQHEIDN
ncbi:MAG: hypothetical protein ABL921_07520 [Pirellula sp.]